MVAWQSITGIDKFDISKIGMDASSTAKFEKLFRTTADEAAAQMLRAVEKNQRRLLIGADAKVLDLVVRIFPSGYQKLIAMGSSRMK